MRLPTQDDVYEAVVKAQAAQQGPVNPQVLAQRVDPNCFNLATMTRLVYHMALNDDRLMVGREGISLRE